MANAAAQTSDTAPSTSQSPPQFFNYPDAKETVVLYKAPPANSNPIFRGVPLLLGSKVIANVPFLAKLLWSNAGFSGLRGLKEIEGWEARYEPVVIPVKKTEDYNVKSYTARDRLRATPSGTPTGDALEGRFWSVKDYHEAYKSGRLTPIDVANALLPLIRRDVKDKTAHSTAFLNSNVSAVLAAAEASTLRWQAGTPLGTLDGIPIAVKDEIDVEGYARTFASSHEYCTAEEAKTSWCVKQWLQAGAVLVGKTNMHEIGMDTTNNNPVAGTPLNPYNSQYYTGGSSGGSGYAVGAGLVPFALGCGMTLISRKR